MTQVTLAPPSAVHSSPCGRFTYSVSERYRSPALEAALSRLGELVEDPSAELIAGGRNRNVSVSLELEQGPLDVVIKAFGRQSRLKNIIDSTRGSKAKRSWLAAQRLAANGVGTPEPIAYVDRWNGLRLEESYFVTLLQPAVLSLNEVLIEMFTHNPDLHDFMAVLRRVAGTCRNMHDAGFAHLDLGNQNILISRGAENSIENVQVIDLNRGRRREHPLTIRERAQDLSRLNLPSGYLELFVRFYWGEPPTRSFERWHRFYQMLFEVRARSRGIRHPIREARLKRERRENPPENELPGIRDLWVWDEKTSQSFSPLTRKERVASYPSGRSLHMLKALAVHALSIRRAYRQVKPTAFKQTLAMSDRIGIAIEPSPDTWERERAILKELPTPPVLIRFYHQDPVEQHEFLFGVVRQLRADGHRIKIALLQDRQAVNDEASWSAFATRVIESIGDSIESAEVGHAINRVKWGIWGFDELARLYAPIPALAAAWPGIEFVGPATIDFEYPFTIAALQEWPDSIAPTSLSLHLYVDRRGAPENPQTGFNSIDKFVLARAISESSDKCSGRVVISEVNWPIDGTGNYSPIAPPFATADTKVGEDEDTYASYMIRYLLLALCSGAVERVYWWRLVAQGYGLIDDADGSAWRKRPGFEAFSHLISRLGDATFVSAQLPVQKGERHGVYAMRFEREGELITAAWAHGEPQPIPTDFQSDRVENLYGRLIEQPPKLTGSPIYLCSQRS